MDEMIFYRNMVWYEMLFNVLLWILCGPGRGSPVSRTGVQAPVNIVMIRSC